MRKNIFIISFFLLSTILFARGYTPLGFIGHDNVEDEECSVQSTSATFVTCLTKAIPDDSGYKVVLECNGIRGDNAEWASIDKCALVKRSGAGSATIVGSVVQTFDQPGTSGWDTDIVVSGNNILLQVKSPAETVNWSCKLRLVKKL